MFELIYRYDPNEPRPVDRPLDPTAARLRLEKGNAEFAALLDGTAGTNRLVCPDDLWAAPDGAALVQEPFAAVLGCADARVPTEIVFGQGFNDLFVVRVAGNVLGSECLGSLDYAVSNLEPSLKLLIVLGHTRCGAVTAAVDSFLEPGKYLAFAPSHPLRAIVDRLLVPVRAAHRAIEEAWGTAAAAVPGYRRALIEAAVGLNAALTAATLRQEFRDQTGPHREVVYGVYDLATRRVGAPVGGFTPGLHPPPTTRDEFDRLAAAVATSPAASGFLAG